MVLLGETSKQGKKQVSGTKSRIAFWSIYFLSKLSFHLKFLSRTLCQTGKDGIAQLEGIVGENTRAVQNSFQTIVVNERT